MTNGARGGGEKLVGEEVVGKQHGGQKTKTRGNSDDDYSDDYSDESFSDSASSSRSNSSSSRSRSGSPSPNRQKGSDSGSFSKGEKNDKSAHSRRSRSTSSERSRSRSCSSSYDKSSKSSKTQTVSKDSSKDKKDKKRSRESRRRRSLESYSDSYTSDSDMTDVSPLNSREGTPSPSPRMVAVDSYSKEKGSNQKPPKKGDSDSIPQIGDDDYVYEPRESRDSKRKGQSRGKKKGKGDVSFEREQFDLNLLMQAVMELDKEHQETQPDGKKVMFIPPHIRNKIEKNYSFNDDQLNDIDRENQRLLQEIMRQNRMRKKRPGSGVSNSRENEPENRRLSHSAVNRKREQRRVEDENMKILQRLQTVRPTRGMSRQDQLKEYRRQVTYGVPSPLKSPGYARSTASWDDEGAPSLASFESTENHRLRPVSGKVRPMSGKLRPQSGRRLNRPVSAISAKVADRRPAWEDRW